MTHYVALDVSLRSVAICIVDDNGDVKLERSINAEVEDIVHSAMRNKTDKNDARGIAQILRSGWFSRVHVKSMGSHHVRALLSSRKAVLNKCIDLENEVRGLLKIFGINPRRFKHSRTVAAHFGLTPRRFQSGEVGGSCYFAVAQGDS